MNVKAEMIKIARLLVAIKNNEPWFSDVWKEYKKEHPNSKKKAPNIKRREEAWRDKEWTSNGWDNYRKLYPNTKIKPKFKASQASRLKTAKEILQLARIIAEIENL